MERPADFHTEPGYDVNEAAKGVVMPSSRRQTPSVEKKSLRINTKKIQRFRNAFAVKKQPSFVEKENSKNRLDSRSRTASDADRKLGTLHVKRVSKADVEETLGAPRHSRGSTRTQKLIDSSFDSDVDSPSSHSSLQSETEASEFDSNYSVRNYPIEVSDRLIERCATQLSTNDMVVGRSRSLADNPVSVGTVRMLAQDKSK